MMKIEEMPEQQRKEFEELYSQYWSYVYKYEVLHIEDFNPDKPWYARQDFSDQLYDEGMTIKVNHGY